MRQTIGAGIWHMAIVAVFTLALTGCTAGDVRAFYEKALPEALQTKDVLAWGSDMHWFDAILPLRTEACGAVIFRLTPGTLEKIRRQGLDFFAYARQARGYSTNSSQGDYYAYAAWQATPGAPGWMEESLVGLSFSCAGFKNSLIRQIMDAAASPGGYFTTKREAELVVLPSLQIAIFAYDG